MRDETHAEHRERDARIWSNLLLLRWVFPGLRSWLALLLAVVAMMWVFNLLGESTVFNDPEIHYAGVDPTTGQHVLVKGCRPERVQSDGGCNKSINWNDVKRAFPFLGTAQAR